MHISFYKCEKERKQVWSCQSLFFSMVKICQIADKWFFVFYGFLMNNWTECMKNTLYRCWGVSCCRLGFSFGCLWSTNYHTSASDAIFFQWTQLMTGLNSANVIELKLNPNIFCLIRCYWGIGAKKNKHESNKYDKTKAQNKYRNES